MPVEALFPLAIYYADLEGSDQYNLAMQETILQLEKTHPSEQDLGNSAWTGDVHGVGNIHDDPRFHWLTDQLEQHCIQYLEELGHDLSKIDLYIQRSWPVISRTKQGVSSHAHHTANISAVYYVTIPANNDEDSGAFVVHNTACQNELQEGLSTTNTKVLTEWNPLNCKATQYQPTSGRLLLFPARQQHSVLPNTSEQLRISVSFDIVMTSSYNVAKDTLEFLPPPPEKWTAFRRNRLPQSGQINDSETLIQTFDQQGYVVFESCLDQGTCAGLLQYILSSVGQAKQDKIIAPNFRLHTPLQYNELSQQAMNQALQSDYANLLQQFLGGEQALTELSSILVFPGAEGQNLHPDERNVGKQLISVFINLAPTRTNAGALWIVPGSHKDVNKQRSDEEAIPLELPIGSAVFMNSKTWHCGGPNRTQDRIRPVFYFSFGTRGLEGPTYSILEEVENLGIRLSDVIDVTLTPPTASAKNTGKIPVLVDGIDIMRPLKTDQHTLLVYRNHELITDLKVHEAWVLPAISLIADTKSYSIDAIQQQTDTTYEQIINLCQKLEQMKILYWQ